ncbi:MAG: Mov34/MPN/PAD-1 family protein [Promethearchaeota archaeon]
MKKNKKIYFSVTESQYNSLVDIARKAYPNESCALLFGVLEKKENSSGEQEYYYKIKEIREMKSSEPSPVAFVLNDFELLAKIWLEQQDRGLRLLSIFHSHPNTAIPSGIDETYMRNMDMGGFSGIIWSIYGNISRDLNAFIYLNNRIYQVNVIIQKTKPADS